MVDLEKQAFLTGGGIVNVSDAFTINGKPGELYPRCKNRKH